MHFQKCLTLGSALCVQPRSKQILSKQHAHATASCNDLSVKISGYVELLVEFTQYFSVKVGYDYVAVGLIFVPPDNLSAEFSYCFLVHNLISF